MYRKKRKQNVFNDLFGISRSLFIIKIFSNYGNPVPVKVSVVPPPVPPRVGLTDVTVGVRAALYVNAELSVLTIEFTVTLTSHVESTRGVDDADVLKKF